MGIDEEVKKMVKDWFSGLSADIYDAGIQKVVTQYETCLNFMGTMKKNYLSSVIGRDIAGVGFLQVIQFPLPIIPPISPS
jgi:hypothetical protein